MTTQDIRSRINALASGEINWDEGSRVFSELRKTHSQHQELINHIESLAGEMSNLVCEIEEASDEDAGEIGADDPGGVESLSSIESLDEEHERLGKELETLMDRLGLPTQEELERLRESVAPTLADPEEVVLMTWEDLSFRAGEIRTKKR